MFEQLRQRFAGEGFKGKKDPVVIEPVQPGEVGELNLTWNSHFNTPTLRQHIQEYPGLTLRVRGYSDYIVGDQWRRRNDIGQLTETRTRHYRAELVASLQAEYARRGYRALVVGSDEQSDNLKFYTEAGYEELERIVYYEKPSVLTDYQHRGTPPVLVPYEHSAQKLAELIAVDNAAFPWLWWNSAAEFEHYRHQEGVAIYLAYQPPHPVGYFGFTLYERWAHLDRLAVVPRAQRQGLGAFQLNAAIRLMAQGGARRVTLSTQLNNWQSQRLYEGFGFERVKSLEYSLIGKWLAEPEPLPG